VSEATPSPLHYFNCPFRPSYTKEEQDFEGKLEYDNYLEEREDLSEYPDEVCIPLHFHLCELLSLLQSTA
jgi:hypothetical protein